ncbi:hypothetical protein Nepgr_009463 [Nepenthes gracilis]|uniref:Uncharacterized protein n=1 Tax=Nepenthes gracilis TaxID=150966 RepID=A0AAD3SAK8_NEPGR|nr:hypothetical protein Nepgr_009463 [Nepenthes gracilis]
MFHFRGRKFRGGYQESTCAGGIRMRTEMGSPKASGLHLGGAAVSGGSIRGGGGGGGGEGMGLLRYPRCLTHGMIMALPASNPLEVYGMVTQ